MHNSSLVTIAQYFWQIRTSVLYGNQKKINTEAVNDYPPIRFQIRFERKFPIVGLYFLTLPVETLWNLCPVEKLFGMRMVGLCQFYWRTCFMFFISAVLPYHLTAVTFLSLTPYIWLHVENLPSSIAVLHSFCLHFATLRSPSIFRSHSLFLVALLFGNIEINTGLSSFTLCSLNVRSILHCVQKTRFWW